MRRARAVARNTAGHYIVLAVGIRAHDVWINQVLINQVDNMQQRQRLYIYI